MDNINMKPSAEDELRYACLIYLHIDQDRGVVKDTDLDAYVAGERLMNTGVENWLRAVNSWRRDPLELSREQIMACWAWFLRESRKANPSLMGPPAMDLTLFPSLGEPPEEEPC